jgi:hypothetical protein
VTIRSFVALCLLLTATLAIRASTAGDPKSPRIVNIYNFIRQNDYRLANSEAVLFEATQRQVELLRQDGLPATFAFQYDALIDPRYQRLFAGNAATNFELAAWWEIPEALARKAGLEWRGHHEWDPAADVGFSPGYTPEERRKLVDVYMAEFKRVFGTYPRTAGSWFIDEVTLEYMASKYGVIASCNCKDQVGTDGYTMWGGYWNQAYYPSRLNAYMPAQTREGQIDIPIFRMLGSDPIYQHGTTPGLFSLEPVYRRAGGSERWVAWFMNNLIEEPALAFGYTQAGQENSFGWEAMKMGFTNQIALFAQEAKAGRIQVQTLAQSGQWFRDHYKLTPPTSVVALDDWKNEGRKTVWYDSRFYRLNVLWTGDKFFIRDLHCFDEHLISPTHSEPLRGPSLAYYTLPIVDTALWSADHAPAGLWPELISEGNGVPLLAAAVSPKVTELNGTDLRIEQPLAGGGKFTITCTETNISFKHEDSVGHPAHWALRFAGGAPQKRVIRSVTDHAIAFNDSRTDYDLQVAPAGASCRQLENGDIRIGADSSGVLVLSFKVPSR